MQTSLIVGGALAYGAAVVTEVIYPAAVATANGVYPAPPYSAR